MNEAKKLHEIRADDGHARPDEVLSHLSQIVARHAISYALNTSTNDARPLNAALQIMAEDISRALGRNISEVSVTDIARAAQYTQEMCQKVGISHLSFHRVSQLAGTAQSVAPMFALTSHAYWIGNLFYGNFGPAVRKLGLEVFEVCHVDQT
jgi:hypothetical protein